MLRLVLLFTFPFVASGQTFEVASVKPAAVESGRSRMRGGPGTSDPGQITFTSAPLTAILLRAYGLESFQLAAPDWMSSRRYDIAAKVPARATKEQCDAMLRALLAERFRLAAHREDKVLAGFDLVVARGGPKLKPAAVAGPAVELQEAPKTDAHGFPILAAPGLALMEGVRGTAVVSFLTAKAQPVSALVDLLRREFRLPISDQSALAGSYDFTLEFAPQRPGALPSASPDAAPESADGAPNLLTAVRQQLGLELSPAKVRVGVLVVDSADQVPSGN